MVKVLHTLIAATILCAGCATAPVADNPDFPPVKFAPAEGGGAEVAVDTFTVFQNPLNYDGKEWLTALLGAAAIGYAGEQTDWFGLEGGGDSSRSTRLPDISGAGGNTWIINGDVIGSTINAPQGSNDEGAGTQQQSSNDGQNSKPGQN